MSPAKIALGQLQTPRGLVGGPFGSNLGKKDYVAQGLPVIRGQNLDRGRFVDFGDVVFVTEDKVRRDLARNTATAGDIVFTQRGTLGQVAMMPRDAAFSDAVVSQSQMRLRVDQTKADPEFVYYACTDASFLSQLRDSAIITGVPHINLGILAHLEIPAFPLGEQRRIAGLLSRFDDLIDANERLAERLEELARAEGRKFLAALAEPDGTTQIADIAQIDKGYSYKSSELVEGGGWLVGLKNVGRDGSFRNDGFKPLSASVKPAQVIEGGDLVVAQTDLTQARDVIGRPVRVRRGNREGQLVASLDLVIVRAREVTTTEYLQAVLESDEFREHALGFCNGTTVLHMGSAAVPSFPVTLPNTADLDHFSRSVGGLRDAADGLRDELEALRRARDELMPLLMSGRVRVIEQDEMKP